MRLDKFFLTKRQEDRLGRCLGPMEMMGDDVACIGVKRNFLTVL